MLAILCAITLVSCSKDTDLLADYVISDDDTLITGSKIVNDTYSIGLNQSIVLDVLSNDNFAAGSTVTIVNVTNPRYGKVVINEDNTLTYTPASGEETAEETSEGESSNDTAEETTENDTSNDSEESQESNEENQESNEDSQESNEETTEDSFDYTTEETNEAGETTTAEGTVTLTTGESKIPTSGSNVYFVSVNGSGNNNGLTENTSWSWTHAVSNARPGMIIYVKAGDYGGGNFRFNQSGSEGNEIKFVGYKDTPGDIDAYKQTMLSDDTRDRRATTRLANNEEFDYTTTPNSSQMPFFNKAYEKEDIFFRIDGDYIEFHNIIIKGGDFGMLFSASSSHAKVINSIILEQGRMDLRMGETPHPDRYQGTGLANRRSENLKVRFCSFLNPEQQALEIRGANTGTYSDNVVYSYNEINGTDYFYLITGEKGEASHDLLIEFNRCHRVSGVAHGGHGFIVKNGAINNTIRNWKVINSNIEASFANATNNLFEKGELNGSYMTDGDDLAYVLTSNGTTGNTFKDIIIDNVWGGLLFLDHGEDRNSAYAGRANDYINIIVKNAKYGVIFSESRSNLGPTNDNRFLNCTFYNTEHGIRAHRNNSGNEFINCHFSASRSLYTNHGNYSLNSNTKFENCHFSGNLKRNDALPFAESNIIDGNPLFQDPQSVINGNFNVLGLQLLDGSPLKGAGQDVSIFNSESATDFNGNTRTVYNIGAF